MDQAFGNSGTCHKSAGSRSAVGLYGSGGHFSVAFGREKGDVMRSFEERY